MDFLETMAGFDRCSAPRTSTEPQNAGVRFEFWSGCKGGSVVEWAVVTGANHLWMGHPAPRLTAADLGPAYMGFDSSAAVWSFLAAHPRG